MKIHFVIVILNSGSGVIDKVQNQISILKNLGTDVELILISNETKSLQNKEYLMTKRTNSYSIFNILKLIKTSFQIAYKLENEIKNYTNLDYIYIRYPNSFLCYPKKIFAKKHIFKIIFEHNTKELEQYKLVSGIFYLLYILDFLFGKFLRSHSDAIICVTDEISQYQLKRCNNPNKPHITLGNGLNVNSVELRNFPKEIIGGLSLLCVANVSKWHGLNRLIEGLTTYRGSLEVTLHIAGDGSDITSLKQLVENLKLQNRVIFHGFTAGAALDNLFNTCHIAVGSLGLHRIGLTESSTLKVREYCARGIPWIIACKDPDFPDDFPYIHRIPADESPVNIEEVIEFAKRVYADPDHPQKMREYSLEHLDWSVKMKKLKAFLESLVDESP